MRILFLSAWCPLPADNGSKLRIWNILRLLSRDHDIDLLSFAPRLPPERDLERLRSCLRSVELVTEDPFAPRSNGWVRGLLSLRPRSEVATFSERMAAAAATRATGEYDWIIASQLHMARYAPSQSRTPMLLEEVELSTLRDQILLESRPLHRLRYSLTWWKATTALRQTLRRFAAVSVVSEPERLNVAPYVLGTTCLAVLPNGIDPDLHHAEPGEPQPDLLIYPGSLSFAPNLEAVEYFQNRVLPAVRSSRPNARLVVTGDTPPELAERFRSAEGIELTGYLEDVRPAIARAWAEVVPLQRGGGSRLKILEALALGTPVVSTTKGAEGLDLQPDRDILVADAPDEFASAVLRLLDSPELREQLAHNGRQAVQRYAWQRTVEKLERLLQDRGASSRSSSAPTPKQDGSSE